MPSQAALTAANLRALSGAPPGAPAADGPDRMADLLERTQMLSELLGQVNAMCEEEGMASDATSSRPSSCRGSTQNSRPASRAQSGRPPSGRPPSGRPQTGQAAGDVDTSGPSKIGATQRLTLGGNGYEVGKPSPIDLFLQGSGRPVSRAPSAAGQPEPELKLYEEGRRVAEVRGVNDENQPVKLVRYTGRQSNTQFQRLRKFDGARAAQSTIGSLLGGEE